MVATILMEIWHPDWKFVTNKSRREVCDLEKHPEVVAVAELKLIGAGTGSWMTWLATLWHMCPEPIQFQCSKLFNHIQFTVSTSVSKMPAKSKYLKKALQVIKRIKRLFLKEKIIDWDSINHCTTVLAIAYTFAAMLVHQLTLKTRTELKITASGQRRP